MNAKNALLAREEKPRKRESKKDARKDKGSKTTRTRDRQEDRCSKPPIGRFASFTLLIAPIDQVLMQIKDDTTLTWPGKLNGDPSKRSRDKYSRFHRDHGHNTSKCYALKQQMEAFIRQGKLQEFVSKERVNPPQEQTTRRDNERPRPPLRDIRMVVKGITASSSSRKACKTYLKMV